MKPKRRVTERGKIARLRASAEEEKPSGALPESWERYTRPNKKHVSLHLDADVLAWFQEEGPGYQTRINRALRQVMREEKRKAEE